MPTLIVETLIHAPREACFDAARDIELHCKTTARTQERAVAGRTVGPIELGDTVTFEAVHLGVRQRLTSKITAFERPAFFVDQMQRGAFRALQHRHEFEAHPEGTLMRDTLHWQSPLGVLGHLADWLFLKRHMHRFLRERNAELKRLIEAGATPYA